MPNSPHSRSPVETPAVQAPIRFECRCRLDDRGAASLELSGELDRAVCSEFESRLAEAQRASAAVTLEMHRLTFMDLSGYAALLFAAQHSRPEAPLTLTGCGGQVARLLDVIGLPERVERHGSEARVDA